MEKINYIDIINHIYLFIYLFSISTFKYLCINFIILN